MTQAEAEQLYTERAHGLTTEIRNRLEQQGVLSEWHAEQPYTLVADVAGDKYTITVTPPEA